jgi:hypothetical protein
MLSQGCSSRVQTTARGIWRPILGFGLLLSCGWSLPAHAQCVLDSAPEGSPCACDTGINRLVCATSPNQSCADVTGADPSNSQNWLCCDGVEAQPVVYGDACGCNNDCCLGACSGGSGTCGDGSGRCEGVSGGPCASSSQCIDGTCSNSVCLGNTGSSCSSNSQCSSHVCVSSVCTAQSVPVFSGSPVTAKAWVVLLSLLLGAAGTLSTGKRKDSAGH